MSIHDPKSLFQKIGIVYIPKMSMSSKGVCMRQGRFGGVWSDGLNGSNLQEVTLEVKRSLCRSFYLLGCAYSACPLYFFVPTQNISSGSRLSSWAY